VSFLSDEVKRALNLNRVFPRTEDVIRSIPSQAVEDTFDRFLENLPDVNIRNFNPVDIVRDEARRGISNAVNTAIGEFTRVRLPNVPGIEYLRNTVLDFIGIDAIHPESENFRSRDALERPDYTVAISGGRFDQRALDFNRIKTPTIVLQTYIAGRIYRITLFNPMDAISETKSANWVETSVSGRYEPMVTYDSSGSRTLSLEGYLLLDTPELNSDTYPNDVNNLRKNIANIRASVFPVSQSGIATNDAILGRNGSKYVAIAAPPLWSLYIFNSRGSVLLRIPTVRINDYSLDQQGPILTELPSSTSAASSYRQYVTLDGKGKEAYTTITKVTLQISEISVAGSNSNFNFKNAPSKYFQTQAVSERT